MKRRYLLSLLLLIFLFAIVGTGCGSKETESTIPEEPGVTEKNESFTEETGENAQSGETEKDQVSPEFIPEEANKDKTKAEENKREETKTDKAGEVDGGTLNKSQSVASGKSETKTQSKNQKTSIPVKAPEKSNEKTNQVTLKVTQDFGTKVIFNQKVEFKKDWTILDILENNLDIETDSDGGFIKGINGLVMNKGGLSGKRTDWFYYVNGICADMGADGYLLRPGETIWWDYHLWENMGLAISAVIGSYPEPFIHGYGGKIGETTVMSSSGKSELAQKVQKALMGKGVKKVSLSGIDEQTLGKRKGPVIVVGEWTELKEVKWLQDFNKAYRKTGTGVHFLEQELELIKYNGEVDQVISDSAGVIVATGSGLGDETPLWLIVGTDAKGLEQAVQVLVNNPEKISGLYNGAVVSGKVISLPVQ